VARPSELPQLDLNEVEALQAELLALVDRMTREADSERQQALVRRISECSDRLGERCAALERKAKAGARELRGYIEVVLTPEQRVEVRRRTGVELESVLVSDNGGGLVAAMPQMDRAQILTLAIAEAEARTREAKAQRVASREFERISDELRRDAPDQIRKEIDRLLDDPEFRRAFEPRSRRPK